MTHILVNNIRLTDIETKLLCSWLKKYSTNSAFCIIPPHFLILGSSEINVWRNGEKMFSMFKEGFRGSTWKWFIPDRTELGRALDLLVICSKRGWLSLTAELIWVCIHSFPLNTCLPENGKTDWRSHTAYEITIGYKLHWPQLWDSLSPQLAIMWHAIDNFYLKRRYRRFSSETKHIPIPARLLFL